MYAVLINGIEVKRYPHKIQANIYLVMHGYAWRSRFGSWLDNKVKVVEVENEKK